jgi:membrane-associated protein
MTLFNYISDLLVHLDYYLDIIILSCGIWTYVILFSVIFSETGLVVAVFLPGDSLILASGIFAARGDLSLPQLLIIFSAAAVLGNTSNYWIGRWLGPKLFKNRKSGLFSVDNLHKADQFYEKYGNLTIVASRFLPLLRTLGPFAAGISKMNFSRFSLFNSISCIAWVLLYTFIGYFFGKLPFIKNNPAIGILIALLVVLIILPFIIRKIHKSINTKK